MKKHFLLLICFIICFTLTAFEWPQENVTENSFSYIFGQLRNGTFNTSLIFTEQAEIKASEKGTVLALLGSTSGEMGWFESPLGNAVILAHNDELLSVYANLESLNIDKTTNYVHAGTKLGTSGSSGWQHGQSSLEFQVIDTQKDTVINPRLLMPRMKTETPLYLHGITAVNRKGEVFDLRTRRNLPAGTYLIYRSTEQSPMTYSTTISVNGAAVETITFDMLTRTENKLTVSGKRLYDVNEIYPNSKKQLLAEITLSQGRNTLNITSSSINGTETSLTYILDIR